eukprot:TRINITY_DN3274_c0_g1_i5.p1 TRINITY_DN3274_c0_g1~~TRINITY_DN3274_c0_g1_i5.p1  ORF type:complete len:555 (+),score=200.59 TRINITY_DN3274_c0_g1_i5:31-1665(+)
MGMSRQGLLQVGGTYAGLLSSFVQEMRRHTELAAPFQQLMQNVDRYADGVSLGQVRQIEKDYWNFDPRNPVARDRPKLKQIQETRGDAGVGLYYRQRERHFFAHLLGMLRDGGFRHVNLDDTYSARYKTFAQHRFKVNYEWLDSDMIREHLRKVLPDDDPLAPDGEVFRNCVAMYVRGKGSIGTSGSFYPQKAEAAVSGVASSLYWLCLQIFPSIAEAADPDVYGWEKVYEERSRVIAAAGSPKDVAGGHRGFEKLDIASQLLGDRSLRHLWGDVELKEETFQDVILVFRRKRPQQAVDAHSLWRTGGGVFNPHNVVIRRYKDVPKSDIKVLLPEKTVIHAPLTYLTLAGSTCTLVYTVGQGLLMGSALSFPQLCIAGAAGGCAYRMLLKLRTSAERHTQLMDSLRDRNLVSTGTGALHDLHHEVKSESQKLALLVYYTLLKHTGWGHNPDACVGWTASDLEKHCTAEYDAAARDQSRVLGIVKGKALVLKFCKGCVAERAVDPKDIGGLDLWTCKKDGAALGLRPHTPVTAHYILRDRRVRLL